MKMQRTGDQLVIDNPLTGTIVLSVVFAAVGLGLGGYGIAKHLLIAMGIGGAFVLGAVLFIVFARSTHIVLSKSGQCTASSKSLFGAARTEPFSLSDVTSVVLSTSEFQGNVKDADGTVRAQTKITASLFLLTKTAQRIRLASTSQNVNVGGIVGAVIESLPLRAEAMQIASFIGVPMQCSDAVGTNQFVQ